MSGPQTDKNEELSSSQSFVSLDGFSLLDFVKITTEAFWCMWREASRWLFFLKSNGKCSLASEVPAFPFVTQACMISLSPLIEKRNPSRSIDNGRNHCLQPYCIYNITTLSWCLETQRWTVFWWTWKFWFWQLKFGTTTKSVSSRK